MRRVGLFMVVLLLGTMLGGCRATSAVGAGRGTTISADEMREMTDRMSRSLYEAVAARQTPMRVVVLPAENHMQAEVLPLGQARLFTARVRGQLQRADTQNRFIWLVNRSTLDALREQELRLARDESGVALPEVFADEVEPQYALTARFDGWTVQDRRRRRQVYSFTFSLVSLEDGRVVWEDSYSLDKSIVRTDLD